MQQRLARIVLGVLLGIPHSAWAQESTSLESIALRLNPGAKLSVITTDGDRFQARFDHATSSELTVVARDKITALPATKIARVIADDSNMNGIAGGAALGVMIGVLGGLPVANSLAEGGDPDGAAVAGFIALGAGAGAAIGWAIDSARHRVVYKAGRHVTIRPQVSSFTPPGATKARTRAGVRATIAW